MKLLELAIVCCIGIDAVVNDDLGSLQLSPDSQGTTLGQNVNKHIQSDAAADVSGSSDPTVGVVDSTDVGEIADSTAGSTTKSAAGSTTNNTVIETPIAHVRKGQYLNFDEIDDLYKNHADGQSHHVINSNSTWRHPEVQERKHSRSASTKSPAGYHVLGSKMSVSGGYHILFGNLKDEDGESIGEQIVVKRVSDGYVMAHSTMNDGDAIRVSGTRDGSDHSLHSAQVGGYHPEDDYSVDAEEEEDRNEINEILRRRRRLQGPATLRQLTSASAPYFGQECEDSGQAERDPEGKISIDLLCAGNEAAVAYTGDIESICVAEVEGINLALKNSGINDVNIRLVGSIILPEANSITSLGYDECLETKALMKPLRAQYGADLLNLWVRAPDDDTRGYGFIASYTSIMEVHALSTLRHEVGHNAGMRHCPEDDKDGTHWVGWLQSETERGTIMCGQDIAAYSNTYMTDGGYPIGQDGVAMAAEAWRSRAAEMSAMMPAVIPYDWEKRAELLRSTLKYENKQASTQSFFVPEGAERVTVMVSAQPEMIKDYPILYVKKDSEPTTSDYDYRSVLDGSKGTRNNAYIHMSPVTSGTYYVMAESNKKPSKIVWDVVAYSFGVEYSGGSSAGSSSGSSSSGTSSGSSSGSTGSASTGTGSIGSSSISGGSTGTGSTGSRGTGSSVTGSTSTGSRGTGSLGTGSLITGGTGSTVNTNRTTGSVGGIGRTNSTGSSLGTSGSSGEAIYDGAVSTYSAFALVATSLTIAGVLM